MAGGIVYLRLGKEKEEADSHSAFDIEPIFLDKSAVVSVEAGERILYILI
jgi:hypothetical protein